MGTMGNDGHEDAIANTHEAEKAEFDANWRLIKPELKVIMGSMPADEYHHVEHTCLELYHIIKGMFMYYAALDMEDYVLQTRNTAVTESLHSVSSRAASIRCQSFSYAGATGQPSMVAAIHTVSIEEFRRFVAEVGLLTTANAKRLLSMSDVDHIFMRVNWERNSKGKLQMMHDENPDGELVDWLSRCPLPPLSSTSSPSGSGCTAQSFFMIPQLFHEWMHAIIRVAHRATRYIKGQPFHDRLRHCIVDIMAPQAGKVDFKEFQGRFSEPAVQDILLQNDFFLKTLFVKYAASDVGEGMGMMLSCEELLELCRDLCIISRKCTEGHVMSCHVAAKRVGQNANGHSDLDWDEFRRAIIRIADKWSLDNTLSLGIKTQILFDHMKRTHQANASNENSQQNLDRFTD
mmetsp:Transcript_11745/g.27890  ORF Transcript_11745/g.27890 Transcript_11745/m.27890 type:complete len:404 (-) Transcript_11745:130-1341(-)